MKQGTTIAVGMCLVFGAADRVRAGLGPSSDAQERRVLLRGCPLRRPLLLHLGRRRDLRGSARHQRQDLIRPHLRQRAGGHVPRCQFSRRVERDRRERDRSSAKWGGTTRSRPIASAGLLAPEAAADRRAPAADGRTRRRKTWCARFQGRAESRSRCVGFAQLVQRVMENNWSQQNLERELMNTDEYREAHRPKR